MNSGLKTPELEEEGNEREGTNLFYPTFFFFFFSNLSSSERLERLPSTHLRNLSLDCWVPN